jgi:hypothetical protein
MRRSWWKRAHVFAVAALLFVASCDRLPQDPIEPAAAAGTAFSNLPVVTSIEPITETSSGGELLSIQGLIGWLGGVLELNGHSLAVPVGAVQLPTLFVMSTPSTTVIDVDLQALLPTLFNKLLDVGGLGFRKPVTVTLSYARATNVTDPSRLYIARILPDGTYEKIPSTVDTKKKTVSAKLDHFSKYCMASN